MITKYSILKMLVIIGMFLFLIVLAICATPGYLFAFSLLLLVLTFGEILKAQQKTYCTLLKWILYVLYLVYSVYNFVPAIFNQDMTITPENASKIIVGVIAPLCLFFVIKFISNIKIKGHKIFNYHVLWILYLIVAIIWSQYYPKEVYLDFLICYWILSYVIIYSYKKIIKEKNIKGEV